MPAKPIPMPNWLSRLPIGELKASQEEFREALRGRVTKHHRFLLRLHLNQIGCLLDASYGHVLDTQAGGENLGPFRTAVELIMSIPGILKNLGAHVIVSGDRNRHEPVLFGRTSHLVGCWPYVRAQRREYRQASIQSPAQGCSMAQNDAGAVRLEQR